TERPDRAEKGSLGLPRTQIGLGFLQTVGELLAKLRNLRGDDDPTVSGGRILAELVLVVFLGSVEQTGRLDLGDDRNPPGFGLLHFRDELRRPLSLLRRII